MHLRLGFAISVCVLATSFTVDAQEIDFATRIRPILEARCVVCHGLDDPEADFSLIDKSSALKGGTGGKAIVPGNAADSPLVRLLKLDIDDPFRMPMEDDPLPQEQIALIETWINQGARWPDNLHLSPPDSEPTAQPDEQDQDAGLPIGPRETAAIEKVQQRGALALRMVRGSHWLRVDFSRHGKHIGDDDLEPLRDMDNLVELNLAGTEITDAGMKLLKDLRRLRRLYLDNTQITDAGLSHISEIDSLEYLNLYGTRVTDEGIFQLKSLTNLRQLYLWQTDVSEDGVAALKSHFIDAEVQATLQRELADLEAELQRLTQEKQALIRAVKRRISGLGPDVSFGRERAAAKTATRAQRETSEKASKDTNPAARRDL